MSNEFNIELNKILTVVRENQHRGKSDDTYHRWLSILGQALPHQTGSGKTQIEFAIERIKDALIQNQKEKELTELREQHKVAIGQSEKIEKSIQLLFAKKHHWTMTPTFWITIAILVVAILTWLFPLDRQKAQVSTQSSSIYAIPSTNHFTK